MLRKLVRSVLDELIFARIAQVAKQLENVDLNPSWIKGDRNYDDLMQQYQFYYTTLSLLNVARKCDTKKQFKAQRVRAFTKHFKRMLWFLNETISALDSEIRNLCWVTSCDVGLTKNVQTFLEGLTLREGPRYHKIPAFETEDEIHQRWWPWYVLS
jgi:hypothetical protein